MSSSEIVNSGGFSGGRSNFSHTCSRLSQYLKRNGSFGDLNLELNQKSESKGTMNLLPLIDESSAGNLNFPSNTLLQSAAGGEETEKYYGLSNTKFEMESAQMTIFYAGQVIVFNNFPPEKAKEIMMFAGKPSSTVDHQFAAVAPPCAVQNPAVSVTDILASVGSDLPIARKNSLARFLGKRKYRATENAALDEASQHAKRAN